MLSESAANEKVLCSFQQKGIGSKVNTLCKLNTIIFALPSALTSSPGNKSLMLQLVPQPEKISGCGMKGVESGQVLLGKFAMCELSTNNCLCSHFLMLHICYGVHRYAPCLFVFFTILNVLFLHLHVFKCECFGNFFACGCLCMCHMRVCV